MWPINSNVNTDILHDDFYSSVERAMQKRFYPRLSIPKTLSELVTVFTSLGATPELRQLSGVSGGGARQGVVLKDWTVTCTAFEWEQTVPIRRSIAVSKPEEVREKTRQMGAKAYKSLDRVFCQSLVSTTALGYDGIALFSASHPESGTNQTNQSTTAGGGGGASTTAAQWETAVGTAVGQMLGLTDDQGTPVNEGIQKFILLCHPTMLMAAKNAFSPLIANNSIDAAGTKGAFRGLIDIVTSAYCTTTGLTSGSTTKAFLFPAEGEADEYAIALGTLADLQFNTNIGNENSDDWNKGEGWLYSWAALGFFPWQWQAAQQITFS